MCDGEMEVCVCVCRDPRVRWPLRLFCHLGYTHLARGSPMHTRVRVLNPTTAVKDERPILLVSVMTSESHYPVLEFLHYHRAQRWPEAV